MKKIVAQRRTPEGEYRIVEKQEVEEIMVGRDIVRHIKAQRIRWFVHVKRRAAEEKIRRVTEWRPERTGPRREVQSEDGRTDHGLSGEDRRTKYKRNGTR